MSSLAWLRCGSSARGDRPFGRRSRASCSHEEVLRSEDARDPVDHGALAPGPRALHLAPSTWLAVLPPPRAPDRFASLHARDPARRDPRPLRPPGHCLHGLDGSRPGPRPGPDTYPLVRALSGAPDVQLVRGYSMFGMSFIYVVFEEGTDLGWARTRVRAQVDQARISLPTDAAPVLGPEASSVGWVFQYVLEDTSGRLDLAQLREPQNFTVRPVLHSVSGFAEVASIGGFERQYQIVLHPQRLASFGITVSEVARAVSDSNSGVGARVLELGGREYILRGRDAVKTLFDLEASLVAMGPRGDPVLIRDIAHVQFGPELRRGAADWDGRGETVGGIVVMRTGSNALDVSRAVTREIAQLRLPDGLRLVPTYDRGGLILGAIDTLRTTLIEEGVIVSLICVLFLFHARSALVAMIVLAALRPHDVHRPARPRPLREHHVTQGHRHRRGRALRRGDRAHRERPRKALCRWNFARPRADHCRGVPDSNAHRHADDRRADPCRPEGLWARVGRDRAAAPSNSRRCFGRCPARGPPSPSDRRAGSTSTSCRIERPSLETA
ncbi:MAG: efflux RND transporter permease subunit [Myxococcales bacterium]|nr:efflux RND transporter permease subunit [Myxococcales bacterium]